MRTPIGIIGYSGSGKTTLAVALVRLFSARGERVAYVKHTHHAVASLGDGGDTRRALDAGAAIVVVADEGAATRWERDGAATGPFAFGDPVSLVASIDAERIVVEGWKQLRAWPVVLVERAGAERVRPVSEIAAVVSDADPGLDAPTFAPSDVEAIARFIDRITGR